ncbi:hypothetical protein HYW17_01750 [Candidatus Uhrbacteria bacterium]|nr:hypothetical protein [Candidatus Uhrbacteria bacterium]
MMKKLLLAVLVFGCNSSASRVSELEFALKKCQAQSAKADKSAAAPATTLASTASVQVVALEQDKPTVATVNYSQPWEGVKDEFDLVNSRITDEYFPSEAGGTATVSLTPLKLHHEGEVSISTEEAERRLDALGFRPATGRELRAFAKADYQWELMVVALGSSLVHPNGLRNVPGLDGWHGRRGLSLYWTDDGWNSSWRFLAVRK